MSSPHYKKQALKINVVPIAALMDPSRLNKSEPSQCSAHYHQRRLFHRQLSAHGLTTQQIVSTTRVVHGYFDDQRFFRVIPGRLIQLAYTACQKLLRADAMPHSQTTQPNSQGTLAFASGGTAHNRTTQIFVNLATTTILIAWVWCRLAAS